MHRQITLTITEGSLQGKGFTVEDRGRYIVGRAEDCDIVLSGGMDALGVSRHHCVLALDPPTLRVRDLGSRNGTFVNGVCIGRRQCSEPGDSELDGNAEFLLHDGDELRVGCFTFEVRIHEASELRAPFYYFPVNLN
jgi:pSer/pThr/pTyr-binding forkhead associated (FHA) protein